MNRILMHTTVLKDEQPFTVATTHFTWSVRGMYSAEQARDAKALLKILDTLPEVILCGDLNSPRDGEPQNLFNTLANRYTDTMPQDLKTSIDGQYHKAGQLMMMVDALFTSNVYQVKKIKIVEGISDHKGIVADIEKR